MGIIKNCFILFILQTVILAVCIFLYYLYYLKNFSIIVQNEILLLAKQQGVTEKLKAENQLKWVGLMNNIKAQVEEKIYAEIVYVRGAI